MAATSKDPVPFRGTAKPNAVVKVYTRGDDILRATVKADHTGFFEGVVAGLADGIYKFYAVAVAAGWFQSRPSGTVDCSVDRTKPTVTDFIVLPTAYPAYPGGPGSATVTSFVATDAVGATGYLITESATPPLLSDPGWSGTAPTQYDVPGLGSYTLYPWARDDFGYVSDVGPIQEFDLILPLPVVTEFTVPLVTFLFAIPVLSFYSDTVYPGQIQGYLITESATPPLPNDPGWSGLVPTSYTVAADGVHTLYAWVVDNFGQVSAAFAGQTVTKLIAPMQALKADAPTSLYEMDENGGGAMLDSSGTGAHGTYLNVGSWVPGQYPPSLAVTAPTAALPRATIPTTGGLHGLAWQQPFSIEFVTYGEPSGEQWNFYIPVLISENFDTEGLALLYSNSLLQMQVTYSYGRYDFITAANTLQSGRWNQYAITRDGLGRYTAYKNGQPLVTTVQLAPEGFAPVPVTGGVLNLSLVNGFTPESLGVPIDYLAFWIGTELTAQQVLEHYQGRMA